MNPHPIVPRYGEAALCDVMPSVASAVGAVGFPNILGIPSASRICLVLVDGLGARSLTQSAQVAPFLSSLPAHQLPAGGIFTTGFPSTTSVALTSLATGLPPARHGMIGYRMRIPETDRVLHSLKWDKSVDPVRWQTQPTIFERLSEQAVPSAYIAHSIFKDSGLSKTAWRGAKYADATSMGEQVTVAASVLREWTRGIAVVYGTDPDQTGHRCGANSPAWENQLRITDLFVSMLWEALPSRTLMIVISDHGMTNVDPGARVNIDVDLNDFDPKATGHAGEVTHEDRVMAAGLRKNLHLLSGEDRCRYFHALPGEEADLLAASQEFLGERAWVASREQAIDEGWFGGSPTREISQRIGDVVVAAKPGLAVSASVKEPRPWLPIGLHGSLTAEEQHIPLLVALRD